MKESNEGDRRTEIPLPSPQHLEHANDERRQLKCTVADGNVCDPLKTNDYVTYLPHIVSTQARDWFFSEKRAHYGEVIYL